MSAEPEEEEDAGVPSQDTTPSSLQRFCTLATSPAIQPKEGHGDHHPRFAEEKINTRGGLEQGHRARSLLDRGLGPGFDTEAWALPAP